MVKVISVVQKLVVLFKKHKVQSEQDYLGIRHIVIIQTTALWGVVCSSSLQLWAAQQQDCSWCLPYLPPPPSQASEVQFFADQGKVQLPPDSSSARYPDSS